MQRLPRRCRADLLVTCHSMERCSSSRIRLESPSLASAVGALCILFSPTDQSLCADNSNTDSRQDDGGIATASFGLDGLELQLSMIYWM